MSNYFLVLLAVAMRLWPEGRFWPPALMVKADPGGDCTDLKAGGAAAGAAPKVGVGAPKVGAGLPKARAAGEAAPNGLLAGAAGC